ncbi:ribonuclease H-like domain-containing protein, partial [Thelephora terrestris]
MAPIARSIKALEGRTANAADVYIFWLAIAASLRNIFRRDQDIDKELAEKVTAIVNRRYKEFIDNSPTDIYFTAFFLDPRYSHSEVLKRPTTMRPTITVPAQFSGPNEVPYPAAAKRAKEFLKNLLQKLWIARDEFIVNIGSLAALRELARQFKLYARRDAPFNSTPSSDTLSWWRALSSSSNANILAFLAIRIYSASVNSMADERTVSNFTWFNSSLRNRQNVATLTWMIQIRQWALHLQNKKAKPLTKPVVAFYDIEEEIYTKARQQADDSAEVLSEEEGSDRDGSETLA